MSQVKRSERMLEAFIGVALLAMILVIADSIRDKVVVVGDTAPHFSITADSGKTLSPSSFGGKVLVVNFWATWCAPCVKELPSLDGFQNELGGQGVVVLGISLDKKEDIYRRFLRRAGVSFQTARDPEAKISGEYGTYRYPESYIIDRSGKVVQKIIGDTDWMDPKMITFVKSLL